MTCSAPPPWYRAAFGPSYLTVYGRRDERDARNLGVLLRAIGYSCPSRRVLDIGCGQGRHLRILEDLGCEAYGIDLSRALLAEARRLSPGESVAQADMRDLPFRNEIFDLALSLFTTFGYFNTDDENARVLLETGRVLRREGQLLLDYLNPVRLRETLVPESRREVGSAEVTETRWIDEAAARVNKRVEIRDAGAVSNLTEVWTESVRLWSEDELKAMVERTGFRILRVMGDFDGTSFLPDSSERMILHCAVEKS